MARDTLTFAIDGDVALEKLEHTVVQLRNLIVALTKELAAHPDSIKWVVDDLQSGSALLTIMGTSEYEDEVDQIVGAYYSVGSGLSENRTLPYSEEVLRPARALTDLLDDDITSIRFETADDDVIIHERVLPPTNQESRGRDRAFGAVSGRIQTISSRQRLRFTLYDFLHDKGVSCYLAEGEDDLIRDMWGHAASVEGEVSRDPVSGRPVAVRAIRSITRMKESEPGSFRRARGALPRSPGDPLPEEAIRRIRDAV